MFYGVLLMLCNEIILMCPIFDHLLLEGVSLPDFIDNVRGHKMVFLFIKLRVTLFAWIISLCD